MDVCIEYKYFLSCLTSFLNGTSSELCGEIDYRRIYELANRHSLLGIVKIALGKAALPADIAKKFLDAYYKTIEISVKQDNMREEVSQIFAENKIDHAFLKGSAIQKYYPVPQMRTCGDIDILIRNENIDNVHKILKKEGFILFSTSNDEFSYKKYEDMRLDIHISLIKKDLPQLYKCNNYLSRAWNFMSEISPFRYASTDEFNFVYGISHLIYHLFDSGIGVRMLFDIAVLIKNANLDYESLKQSLVNAGIYDCTERILTVCKAWFEIDVPFYSSALSPENIATITNTVLRNQTHGIQNILVNRIRNDSNTKNRYSKMFFLPYNNMKCRYPILINHPSLLPIMWIIRGFSLVKSSKKIALDFKYAYPLAKKQIEINEILGLKNSD